MRGECPTPRPDCPYANRPGGCFSDTDHLYFPALDYSGIMEAEFRELPENKQRICRWDHEQKHKEELPPEKPSKEYMLGALALAYYQGKINLSKRKLKKLGFEPK